MSSIDSAIAWVFAISKGQVSSKFVKKNKNKEYEQELSLRKRKMKNNSIIELCVAYIDDMQSTWIPRRSK